jgi:hypothetical protein
VKFDNLIKEVSKQALSVSPASSSPQQLRVETEQLGTVSAPVRLVVVPNDSSLEAESPKDEFMY